MSSHHRKAFQAYLVPNVTNVPGIPGPYFYRSSTHTWSLLWPSFQTYLVPIITNVPCIPSLPLYYDFLALFHFWANYETRNASHISWIRLYLTLAGTQMGEPILSCPSFTLTPTIIGSLFAKTQFGKIESDAGNIATCFNSSCFLFFWSIKCFVNWSVRW